MIHHVLKSTHTMIGLETHPGLIGIIPVPVMPHVTGAPLSESIWGEEEKTNHDILSGGAKTLARGHDVGNNVPHLSIPPHILLVVHTCMSGSKSMFGASSILTPKGPLAVSLFEGGNLNLNCSDPMNLPLGAVETSNTHLAGLTVGDVLAGLGAIVLEMAVSFIVNRLAQVPPVKEWGERIANRICPEVFRTVMRVTGESMTMVVGGGERLVAVSLREVAIERVLADPMSRALAEEAMDKLIEQGIEEAPILLGPSGIDSMESATERLQEQMYEAAAPEYPRRPPGGGE